MKKLLSVVLLAMFGLFAFAVYRVFSGPPRPVSFASLPPQEQRKRCVEAQNLVEQVEIVAKRARARQSGNFTLSATPDQLNTLLQDRIRGENLPISDLGVALEPGKIVVSGTAQRSGLSVPVALSGPLEAQGGELKFRVEDLTLGGFPAPGDWKAKAQRAVGGGLERLFGAAKGARFEKVEIESDKITVSGQTG